MKRYQVEKYTVGLPKATVTVEVYKNCNYKDNSYSSLNLSNNIINSTNLLETNEKVLKAYKLNLKSPLTY